MNWWDHLIILLDLVLIAPYRWFENPVNGFFFGTFVLCLWCVFAGEITFRIGSWINRNHIRRFRANMVRMHNLSVKALIQKDKENYRACNKEANEAFGKYFFNMITMGAAVLWPVPFALGWMNTRFGHIEFELLFALPVLGKSVGFAAVLIPMYILCRIFWAKIKKKIPDTPAEPGLKPGETGQEEMISMHEVEKEGKIPERFWDNSKS